MKLVFNFFNAAVTVSGQNKTEVYNVNNLHVPWEIIAQLWQQTGIFVAVYY